MNDRHPLHPEERLENQCKEVEQKVGNPHIFVTFHDQVGVLCENFKRFASYINIADSDEIQLQLDSSSFNTWRILHPPQEGILPEPYSTRQGRRGNPYSPISVRTVGDVEYEPGLRVCWIGLVPSVSYIGKTSELDPANDLLKGLTGKC